MFQQAWNIVKAVWNTDTTPEGLESALAELRSQAPTPVFWLFGKTQSGKTSLIRFLTGAEDAVIGNGFRPCTKTSREYPFPTADAPLLKFLDTRGLDEAGYDPRPDLEAFGSVAHVMIVTAKLRDLAQGNVRDALRAIRSEFPNRPVVLALTCLHEAYPQRQHPSYPPTSEPEYVRLRDEQATQFEGLHDAIVSIDLTHPDEGYTEPYYGGDELKSTLLRLLPNAYRQSLANTAELTASLKDIHGRHAGPIILGYASLAGTAGSLPIPFVDLVLLPGIQSRMVYHLAKIYGQELTAVRFLELAGSIGIGLLAKTAARQLAKLIPGVGSAAGAALAAASTFALGKAFCLYYEQVHEGHVPDAAKLRSYYEKELAAANQLWNRTAR
ncbi:MAG: DUF697 domain-containing protein [Planctomycetia bacterium]|nr:DUF697 domain-containing protein [Planctomycetia bacterium]